MLSRTFAGAAAALVLSAAALAAQPGADAAQPILFEGARVITGEDEPPIDNAVVLVQDGVFVEVGAAGEVRRPPNARRVDVRGRTMIPGLINAHVHLGYDRGETFSAQNFTREHLLAQLERYAYAGVAAVTSLGTDPNELPFSMRPQQALGFLGGALYLTAGRGIAPPNAGPANAAMRPAPYGVSTDADARAAVTELAGKRVDLIKIWVDNRNGTVEKLSPALYRTIIGEAHKYGTRVIAHVYYLDDMRDLVEAGVDGFAHLPRDLPIDEPLAIRMRDRGVFVLPNLSISENGTHDAPPPWIDDPLLHDVVAAADIARLRASYGRRSPEAVTRARATYSRMQQSLRTLTTVGVPLGFGTDAGASRDHFHAFTDHRELQLMVDAGLTEMQALIAATRISAEILGLTHMGGIVPGKSADFVLLDANPLDDISNTRAVATVFLRGQEVNRAALRAGWSQGGQP